MSFNEEFSSNYWKYAARIFYLGTNYCGWQRQDVASGPLPSIQQELENALLKITGEKFSVVGSGRTDSGVHSIGQVFHFSLRKKNWEPWILEKALDFHLPSNIRVHHILRAPVDFHAQHSAVKKQYSYYFQQGPCSIPHLSKCSWWIKKELDIEAMQKCVLPLLGKHEFKVFQASGGIVKSTVREIFEIQVQPEKIYFPGESSIYEEQGFKLIRLKVVGSGFLKQMVRAIAGTVLTVGEGKKTVQVFEEILEKADRSLLGKTAVARGLWLEKVWYENLDI